jgi:radical SAM protein with 4Fe4S-binding SPASM domain
MPMSPAENAFWSDFGYHRGETVLRNLPQVFAVESTNYCNIKCVMCPRGEPDIMTRELGHMSTALFERVLDQAVYFTDPCWFHWFGEPLMNPRLFEQIALAKRKVPNLGISTNATLLGPANAERVLDSGLDTILIAVDGATKEVYERVRKGPFPFERVRENVERFLEMKRARGVSKPHTMLSIIVMDETANDLESFREHWQARGANEVIHKPFTDWGGQDDRFLELALPSQRPIFRSPRAHPCKHLWQSVVIAWDGRVVPCCLDYDAKMQLGDLKTTSLAEIWNGPAYVTLREAELAGRNCSALCACCNQAPGHARDPNFGEGQLLQLGRAA